MNEIKIIKKGNSFAYIGTSNSGKTITLYNTAIKKSKLGYKVLFISLDENLDILIERFGLKVKFYCPRDLNLMELTYLTLNYDYIFIDEIQHMRKPKTWLSSLLNEITLLSIIEKRKSILV